MTVTETLEKILPSFEVYYNVKREDVTPPFVAEAAFHSHDEQYFLVRSARLAESESNEYVFFATADCLDEQQLLELDKLAWETGLSRVKPHSEHKNTDITLFIICNHMTEEAFQEVSGLQHYKSYKFSLHGWSHYRLVALEASSGRAAYNRQGQSLKKLISNIQNIHEKESKK